jgi:hydrogenase expression/formation protein HypC
VCLGIPRRVLSVDATRGVAEVEVAADRQRISIQLLQHSDAAVEVGDWVVVHMGLAMETMDESDALQTLQEIASLEDLDAWLVPAEPLPEDAPPR